MTIEELQKKIEELTSSLESVQETNNGLKADLKKAKEELRKGQGVDPAEFNSLQSQLEATQAKISESEKLVKKLTGDNDAANKKIQEEASFNHRLLVENGLTEALTKAGVTNPAFLWAVKSTLASQVQVVTEGENRIAKAGDKNLADFVTEWAKSDEGKHFVSAQNNSGGGSQGGGSNPNQKTMTRAQFDAADQGTRAAFAKEGGKVVD